MRRIVGLPTPAELDDCVGRIVAVALLGKKYVVSPYTELLPEERIQLDFHMSTKWSACPLAFAVIHQALPFVFIYISFIYVI